MIANILLFNPANAQIETKKLKNEIGIDLSNTIYLIRKTDNLFPIYYKRHFDKNALRLGLNLIFQTNSNSGEKAYNLRAGYEWSEKFNNWVVYYGGDLTSRFQGYNYQKNKMYSYGISPFIGFRYHFSDRFSLSTEPNFNVNYTIYRDPSSFSKTANTEEFNSYFGSIGVVLVNFLF